MTNDSLTRTFAAAAAGSALAADAAFLRTQETALAIARSDFGSSSAPNRGGFNSSLARAIIAAEFARATG